MNVYYWSTHYGPGQLSNLTFSISINKQNSFPSDENETFLAQHCVLPLTL